VENIDICVYRRLGYFLSKFFGDNFCLGGNRKKVPQNLNAKASEMSFYGEAMVD